MDHNIINTKNANFDNLPMSATSFQQVPSSGRHSRSPSVGSRTGSTSSGRCKIPHSFSLHTYTRPTVCQHCKKLLRGLFKQGVQCKDCQYNAHKKCVDDVPKNCNGESESLHRESESGDRDSFYREEFDDSDDTDDGPILSPSSVQSFHHAHRGSFDHQASAAGPLSPVRSPNGGDFNHSASAISTYLIDHDEAAANHQQQTTTPERPTVTSSPSANIPLMRIVQSIKHTKRRNGQAIKEGWLVHFTNKEKLVRRHYWRLDSKAITMFVSDQGSKYFKEIPLNEILAIDTARNLSGNEAHCFQIRTANVDFYVGQDPLLAYRVGEPLVLPPPDSGIGAHLAKSWETAIRQALMPVTSNNGEFKVFFLYCMVYIFSISIP